MAPIPTIPFQGVDLMDALKKDFHEKLDRWTGDEGDFYDFWKLYEGSNLWWHGRFRLIDLNDANHTELINVIEEAIDNEPDEFFLYSPMMPDETIGYYGQRKLEKDPYFKTIFEEKFPYVSQK
jgi:hypothetical protein